MGLSTSDSKWIVFNIQPRVYVYASFNVSFMFDLTVTAYISIYSLFQMNSIIASFKLGHAMLAPRSRARKFHQSNPDIDVDVDISIRTESNREVY